MKTNVFLILLVFLSQSIFSQIYISKGQEVYGTWKKSNSPYIIDGEAIVPAGKTLTIKKGVEVKFKTGTNRDYRIDGYKANNFDLGFLRVEGTIIAKGSETDKIKFTSNGDGNWGTIFINSRSDKNYFSYCIFEKGYHIRGITDTDNSTGVLTFLNSTGKVENCLFLRNGWTAINCKQSSNPTITNVTIVKNNYGLECNSSSAPTIKNTIIWKNYTALYMNGGAHPSISYSLIQDPNMERAYDKGNNIFGQNPDFKDEVFDNYTISSSSICRKAGEKGADIGSK
jgi:hypothetical protein